VCSLRGLKSLVEARPVCLGVPEQLFFMNSAEHASSFSQACLFSWTYITISAIVQRLIHNGKQLWQIATTLTENPAPTHASSKLLFPTIKPYRFDFFKISAVCTKAWGCDFGRSSEEQAVDRVVFRMPSPPSRRQETRGLDCVMRMKRQRGRCSLSSVVQRTGHRVRRLTASGKLLCLKPGQRAACA